MLSIVSNTTTEKAQCQSESQPVTHSGYKQLPQIRANKQDRTDISPSTPRHTTPHNSTEQNLHIAERTQLATRAQHTVPWCNVLSDQPAHRCVAAKRQVLVAVTPVHVAALRVVTRPHSSVAATFAHQDIVTLSKTISISVWNKYIGRYC